MVDITDLPVPGQDITDLPAPPMSEQDARIAEMRKHASNFDANFGNSLLSVAGTPMSTLANIANLGIAGYGTAKQALGYGPGPNPIDTSKVPGTSDYLVQNYGTQPAAPESSADKYMQAAQRGMAFGPAGAAYSAAGQTLHDYLPKEADTGQPNPSIEAAANAALMFGPGLAGGAIKDGAYNWARSKLKDAVSANPTSSTADAAAAERFGGPQTIAQTTNSGLVRTLARQSQGQEAANVGQVQADYVANKLTAEARSLAPVPVTTPGVSEGTVQNLTQALQKRDAQLRDSADRGYTSGLAHVAALTRANPEPVEFPALTTAAQRILGENADVWNTAPKELEGRVRTLLSYLLPPKPTVAPGAAIPPRVVTAPNAVDAMKLGKALNQQYSAKERGALTDNMDQVFAELKAAYHQDLTNAPANPAIDKLRQVNADYAAGQGRIKELQDSVANSTLKALGTTDPDKAIQKFANMDPHAQRYVRDILLQNDPTTLRALQGHYIDLHLNAAQDAGRPSMLSRTDVHALNPENLVKTGMFDSATVQQLQDAQGYINTIRNFFPESNAGSVGVNINAASRIAGGVAGGVASPVFIGGAALHYLSAGYLQKLLLTPEGRQQLLQGASSPDSAMALARKIALYNQATQKK